MPTVNFASEQFILGLIGGAAAELLHWYALSRTPRGVRRFMLRPLYWICTGAMIALSGLVPLLYVLGSSSAVLCFHLGAATPLILQKLIVNAPALTAAQGHEDTNLRAFFAW